MNRSTASPQTACVDTSKAWFSTCERCGARTMICTGEESSTCVTCLFQLALDQPDTVSVPSAGEEVSVEAACGTLGPFELLEEIGRGGMGVIYKARRGEGDEVLALKVLLPPREEAVEARVRFEREARVLAALHHPYVMPVHNVFLDGEMPYFSMDYAPGGSLAEVLSKYRGRWRQAAHLMVQVAEAVHYAHRQNLLHRDLKPGNILFTEDYQPLVSDFGLAKWLDDTGPELTQSLVMFGTPSYVSPEQASGKHRELTSATDIYSLGAILFELLAGRPPFVGDSPLEVLQQALVGPAPRLRSVAPALPADLEAICARCLATKPDERYPSAAELAEDIKRWLRGKRVVARTPWNRWLPERLGKKRSLCIGAAAAPTVAVAVAACLPLRSWHFDRQTVSPTVGPRMVTVQVDDFSPDGDLDSFSGQLSRAMGAISDDAFTLQVLPVRRLTAVSNEGARSMQGEKTTLPASRVALRQSVRRVESRVRVVSEFFGQGAAHSLHTRVDWLPFRPSEQDFDALRQTLRKELVTDLVTRNPELHRPTRNEIEASSFCKKAAEFFHRITRTDNDHAIVLYQSALKLQPNNVSAQAGLADAYRMKFYWWGGDQRDLERARQFAEQALVTDPFSAEAHHAMGCCLVAAKRFGEAREELLQEVEIDPDSAGGNVYIGLCCRELGQLREGLLWLRRAAQLDPVHGVFNMAVGEIYMLTGDDRAAEREFSRAFEIDPEQPDARNALAVLALWQGRRDDARELSRDLLARFATYPYREQLAAEVAFFCGDSAEALTSYSQLAASDTYSVGMEYFGAINPASAVACLLQKEGKLDEASRRLIDAKTIDDQLLVQFPNNPRLLHDLAAISTLEGDYEHALSYLSSALQAGWAERRSTLMDPRFEALRGDQRFAQLLAESSLSAASNVVLNGSKTKVNNR